MFFKQIIHSCTFFGHARGGRGRGDHVRGRVAWGGGGGRGIEREGHDSHRWRRGQSCLVRQRGRIRRSSSLSLVLALLTYPRDSPNTLELTEHLEINSKWPEIPPKKTDEQRAEVGSDSYVNRAQCRVEGRVFVVPFSRWRC